MKTRLVNIMVTKKTDKAFSPDLAIALREYADAIEEANASWDESKTAGRHNPDLFETSNGCKILVISGTGLFN